MNALVLFGLLFGDEGKGKITDAIARQYGIQYVFRYNGGPQAGHNVLTSDNGYHCFAQFGSGTLAGSNTYISHFMPVQLEALDAEAKHLSSIGISHPLARISINIESLVITPGHILVGQIKEIARRESRHGSCGMGVGEAILDAEQGRAIQVKDLLHTDGYRTLESLLDAKWREAQDLYARTHSPHIKSRMDVFRDDMNPMRLFEAYVRILDQLQGRIDTDLAISHAIQTGPVIFEGAQGALLDRYGGFIPHVTKSRSTYHNVQRLRSATLARPTKIGIMRCFSHRHGRGPLVTEDPRLSQSFADPQNKTNAWQESFRVGYLDIVALRYGLRLNEGADALAITHLDTISNLPRIPVCTAYRYEGDPQDLGDRFEWYQDHSKTIITDIRSNHDIDGKPSVTNILFRCIPFDWMMFNGWNQIPDHPDGIHDLPHACRSFLDWLASPQGLGTPVGIASYGPRSDQTLFFLES